MKKKVISLFSLIVLSIAFLSLTACSPSGGDEGNNIISPDSYDISNMVDDTRDALIFVDILDVVYKYTDSWNVDSLLPVISTGYEIDGETYDARLTTLAHRSFYETYNSFSSPSFMIGEHLNVDVGHDENQQIISMNMNWYDGSFRFYVNNIKTENADADGTVMSYKVSADIDSFYANSAKYSFSVVVNTSVDLVSGEKERTISISNAYFNSGDGNLRPVEENAILKVCDIVNACYANENDKDFGDRPYIRSAMKEYRDLVRIRLFLYSIYSQISDRYDDVYYRDPYPAYDSVVGSVLNQLNSSSLTKEQKNDFLGCGFNSEGTFEYPENSPVVSATGSEIKFIDRDNNIEAISHGEFNKSGYSSGEVYLTLSGPEYEKGEDTVITLYYSIDGVVDAESRLFAGETISKNDLTSKWQYVLSVTPTLQFPTQGY